MGKAKSINLVCSLIKAHASQQMISYC